MTRSARFDTSSVVPFLAILGGLLLSVWRFRAQDPVGGLVAGVAGVIAMIALATWLPAPKDPPTTSEGA